MLSEKAKNIVKATTPIIEEKGIEIAQRMYDILFMQHPELKKLFANAPKTQPAILAQAILAYCNNIDKLDVLTAAIEEITNKHVATQVKAEHYPLVGNAILQAIQDVVGSAATPEVLEGWAEAYQFLADVLIQIEAKKYASLS
ncbi:hemoglobin-like flavoprotein [Beggiatoa alba B18LD]|uniref:Hemoglobin-like flavoprotein n=1 Tax=Beggiatoa alba B18LD TaxID=395493 RepID=I3CEW5_9GAMM|nr:globin domain-containing protein [Beggiatoa alba]EIJ42158.1 hemoglobin-like flavoprotein [Beggiatoa alba B18LD]